MFSSVYLHPGACSACMPAITLPCAGLPGPRFACTPCSSVCSNKKRAITRIYLCRGPGVAEKRQLAEQKIAVLQKALEHHPSCLRLQTLLLDALHAAERGSAVIQGYWQLVRSRGSLICQQLMCC